MNKKVPVWALFSLGVFYSFYKPKALALTPAKRRSPTSPQG